MNVAYNQFAAFMNIANESGIAVDIAASPSDGDLNALQALARQELLVSQEAPLGIAGVRLSAGFNALPASAFVNVAGSTYNSAAQIAAIEPLYHAGLITASGSVGLSLPSQIVLQQGVSVAPGGFSIDAAASDSSNRIAVVLIDLAGTLSATQVGGATVTRNGPNILILNGTPADVAAELATLTLEADVAGPDSIDVEVFGRSGRIGGGSVPILATSGSGGGIFVPDPAGPSAPPWQSASAQVVNDRIVSETFIWNTSNGLAGSDVIGATAIKPLVQVPVAQPLLQRGLTASGTAASLRSFYSYLACGLANL